MNKFLIAAIVATTVSASAFANPVLSENFDNSAFVASGSPYSSFSDNWTNTNYYAINEFNGWNFSGGVFYAANPAGGGALLLNEGGGSYASKVITGLTAGVTYQLSFNVWGDNLPGQIYGLDVSLDGNKIVSLSDLEDKTAGYYNNSGGILHKVSFTATEIATTLRFTETTPYFSGASPIIDNVMIAAVPEPETYAMFLAGLGLMGGIARRRKQK